MEGSHTDGIPPFACAPWAEAGDRHRPAFKLLLAALAALRGASYWPWRRKFLAGSGVDGLLKAGWPDIEDMAV
jgi:hypothetical protein